MYIKSCLRMLHELKAFLSQSRSEEKKRGGCKHRTREASYDVSEALKSATKQHQSDKKICRQRRKKMVPQFFGEDRYFIQ